MENHFIDNGTISLKFYDLGYELLFIILEITPNNALISIILGNPDML